MYKHMLKEKKMVKIEQNSKLDYISLYIIFMCHMLYNKYVIFKSVNLIFKFNFVVVVVFFSSYHKV